MLNSIIRKPALVLTLPLFALIAASYSAHAEIYKWRDNRGVIQYSDRPPVTNFTKVTRNEMVNALQTKDLCTIGPIVKNNMLKVASNQNAGAFFTKLLRTSTTGTAPKTTTTSLSKTTLSAGKLSTTSTAGTFTTSSTSTTAKNTSFLSGGKNVTVLSFSKKPIKTLATLTSPTTTTTLTSTTATPTTAAPTPTTTADVAPIQVATTSSSPATTLNTGTSANLIQVGLMPAVDISKNMFPALGTSIAQVTTTDVQPGVGSNFRIVCKPSHMSNDDPLVYPGQQGAAHHHIFFGNTSVNYKSDLSTLSTIGNSTCAGGTLNRSAYWTPTLIDTATNTPVVPDFSIFYYKKNVDTVLVAPPKGLRMLSGNSKATTESEGQGQFICFNSNVWNGWKRNMSSCEAGDILFMTMEFPSCWDGKNLDSPNHKDHMARPEAGQCPTSHPVAIPVIIMNLEYKITQANQNAKWRLASDNYSSTLPGGYSMHADWVNGWDENIIAGIVKNCINGNRDAGAHLLCDGRSLY